MISIEELVDAIVSQNPNVSRETILRRLEEERKKSGGLISDEVLLRMIAAEFGVKLSNVVYEPSLTISGLVAGLSDVSITGRIIAVFPPKALEKVSGSKFASVLVADRSGALRVVLWNDKAELVNSGKLRVGHVVRFIHGYTRESRSGHVELHISGNGEVEVLEDMKAKGYPTVIELATKIAEVAKTPREKRVNIVGIVKETSSQKGETTARKVTHFVLADETGQVSVIVWNERVDEVKKFLKKGVPLQIVNAKIRKASNGGVEVHVDRETYIDVLKFTLEEGFWKIAELKEGMKNISVQGTVATKPLLRKVKTAKGETLNLAVFEIKDETGSIWVSAWRKNAEKAAKFKPGEKIAIKNADVKRGFADQLEITTKNATMMENISAR